MQIQFIHKPDEMELHEFINYYKGKDVTLCLNLVFPSSRKRYKILIFYLNV